MSANPTDVNSIVALLTNALNDYARTLGFSDAGSNVSSVFREVLNAGVYSASALMYAKQYLDRMKAQGSNPYREETQFHAGGLFMRNFILGKVAGITLGTPDVETADDRARHLAILFRQRQAALAEIAAGGDSNLAAIDAQINSLLYRPLYGV